jgi:hypothetical protein
MPSPSTSTHPIESSPSLDLSIDLPSTSEQKMPETLFHKVTRVNSTNVLDEGLRIGGRATTRDSEIEIGTRRTQVHVPAVEDRYILLAI